MSLVRLALGSGNVCIERGQASSQHIDSSAPEQRTLVGRVVHIDIDMFDLCMSRIGEASSISPCSHADVGSTPNSFPRIVQQPYAKAVDWSLTVQHQSDYILCLRCHVADTSPGVLELQLRLEQIQSLPAASKSTGRSTHLRYESETARQSRIKQNNMYLRGPFLMYESRDGGQRNSPSKRLSQGQIGVDRNDQVDIVRSVVVHEHIAHLIVGRVFAWEHCQ